MSETVYSARADMMRVDQRICSHVFFFHGFPKWIIVNHVIPPYNMIILSPFAIEYTEICNYMGNMELFSNVYNGKKVRCICKFKYILNDIRLYNYKYQL